MKILISEKLKDYRKANNLTQFEFSSMIGVSPQAVSKWEREECFPDIIFLPTLASVFGCLVDDLFIQD